MHAALEVRHSCPTSREREALSFPRTISEIEINDVLVGDACAHRLCFEIINDIYVQLNGYFFHTVLVAKRPFISGKSTIVGGRKFDILPIIFSAML